MTDSLFIVKHSTVSLLKSKDQPRPKVDYKNGSPCMAYVTTITTQSLSTSYSFQKIMASLRSLFMAFFIVLSLSCIGEVQASRKLLAPTFANIPGFNLPPFPPITDWPEYRLPPELLSPNFPSGFFSPPASTTETFKP
ncbi:hypothetical protein Fmac_005115 [Flemingia macrophylla]|uniref:Uncharacterized protein n=1 Tax=Flemingia macrophylla TaxID=520843 RepID=A0ABD1N6U4_9FABA